MSLTSIELQPAADHHALFRSLIRAGLHWDFAGCVAPQKATAKSVKRDCFRRNASGGNVRSHPSAVLFAAKKMSAFRGKTRAAWLTAYAACICCVLPHAWVRMPAFLEKLRDTD